MKFSNKAANDTKDRHQYIGIFVYIYSFCFAPGKVAGGGGGGRRSEECYTLPPGLDSPKVIFRCLL